MSQTNAKARALSIAQDKPILVGVDDGHAMIKLAMMEGDDFKLIKIRSRARAGVQGISAIGRTEGQLDGGYETESLRFTVTDNVDGEETRFDEYQFSPLNRVLIHHALRLAGLGGKAVQIATGLPVAQFFLEDMVNVKLIERKTRSIMEPVRTLSGLPSAEIMANFVFAEGIAAWVDYAVDNKGNLTADLGRPVAVIDIGGRTTDCVKVLPGWRVDHARSGTENIGVLDLYAAVRRRVCAEFDIPSVDDVTIEEAVNTGKIRIWNQEKDISEIVKVAKIDVSSRILREVQRRIGKGHDLEKVIFVGGGAAVFGDLMQVFPNGEIPKNPEFSNARGLLKFMAHVM